MHEASKTNRIRGAQFVQRHFEGKKVLDIGCGADVVVPWATPFDLADGDANRIADYLPAQSFDVVHSSHCLEHMHQPPEALAQWWSLIKPGGTLITVVPDEELYEQGLWPSMFNGDHKWAFTLDAQRLWGTHVLDLKALHLQLPGAELVDLQKHDIAYRRDWLEATRKNLSAKNFARYRHALHWVRKCRLEWLGLDGVGWSWLTRHGVPVDQTSKDAMAQLQIILRKQA
jgi:SAM-dependent methyltransferase